MENKYYIPSIKEFHVGFEFEEYCRKEWRKMVRPPDNWGNEWVKLKFDTSHSISRITSKIVKSQVRIKHLSKSDIESLGWDFEGGQMTYNGDRMDFIKGIFTLHFYPEDNNSRVQIKVNTSQTFDGHIRNISELKVLLKQLLV